MNKFEIAELINNLKNRIEEIEKRFKIENYCYDTLFMTNTRLALGIDDEKKDISKLEDDEVKKWENI